MQSFLSWGDISVAAVVFLVAKAYVDWKTKKSLEELKAELSRKTKGQQEIGVGTAQALLTARSTLARELARLRQAVSDLSAVSVPELSRQKFRADARRAIASMKEPLDKVLTALPDEQKPSWRELRTIVERYEAEEEVELPILSEITQTGEDLLRSGLGAVV